MEAAWSVQMRGPCRNTRASATKSKDAHAFMEPDSQPLMLHGFDTVVYFVHPKAHPPKASWSG